MASFLIFNLIFKYSGYFSNGSLSSQCSKVCSESIFLHETSVLLRRLRQAVAEPGVLRVEAQQRGSVGESGDEQLLREMVLGAVESSLHSFFHVTHHLCVVQSSLHLLQADLISRPDPLITPTTAAVAQPSIPHQHRHRHSLRCPRSGQQQSVLLSVEACPIVNRGCRFYIMYFLSFLLYIFLIIFILYIL